MAAIRPKVAYYAVQNVASVFDNHLQLQPDFRFTKDSSLSMSVFGFKHQVAQHNVVALWLDKNIPSNAFDTKSVTISFENVNFKNPVWVDLLTGSIFEIPKSQWKKEGNKISFTDIPLYDSPVLITEKAMVIKK
jgi:hypothetical protein